MVFVTFDMPLASMVSTVNMVGTCCLLLSLGAYNYNFLALSLSVRNWLLVKVFSKIFKMFPFELCQSFLYYICFYCIFLHCFHCIDNNLLSCTVVSSSVLLNTSILHHLAHNQQKKTVSTLASFSLKLTLNLSPFPFTLLSVPKPTCLFAVKSLFSFVITSDR